MKGKEPKQELQNITLHLLDLSDADDFLVLTTDEKGNKFGFFEPCESKEEALEYLDKIVIPHAYYKAICLDNQVIGVIFVTPMDDDRHRGELGYILGSGYWGKGIGARVVEMVVWSIFAEWPSLERLEALVDVENTRSQWVLEKNGFTREAVLRKYAVEKGIARDILMFSIVSTDPQISDLRKD